MIDLPLGLTGRVVLAFTEMRSRGVAGEIGFDDDLVRAAGLGRASPLFGGGAS
jgi:hypothetical protein